MIAVRRNVVFRAAVPVPLGRVWKSVCGVGGGGRMGNPGVIMGTVALTILAASGLKTFQNLGQGFPQKSAWLKNE